MTIGLPQFRLLIFDLDRFRHVKGLMNILIGHVWQIILNKVSYVLNENNIGWARRFFLDLLPYSLEIFVIKFEQSSQL